MEKQIVMGIGGHPADIIAGAGGTIVNHRQEGDDVIIVSITDGALSHGGLIYDELNPKRKNISEKLYAEVVKRKEQEVREAGKVLGVKELVFLGYEDEPLLANREIIIDLAKLIRKYKPTAIITHYPNENDHDDHQVVGEMVLRAVKAASNVIIETDLLPHFVNDIYFLLPQYKHKFEATGHTLPLPNILVDISNSIELKKEAVGKFKSQKYIQKWLDKIYERINGYTAYMQGIEYAEEFVFNHPVITSRLLPPQKENAYALKGRIFKTHSSDSRVST